MPLRKEKLPPRRRPSARSAGVPRRTDLTANDAAVLLLERMDAKRRGERDPVRVARADAGDEGVDRVVENLGAKPAESEGGNRFHVGGHRCDEGLAPQAELRPAKTRDS